MIIDSHAHLVAPPSFQAAWTMMEAAGTYSGRTRMHTSDEELLEWADKQIAMMDEVGTDVQFTSARPYTLKHSHKPGKIVEWWVQNNNDAIAVQAAARPDRIKGVGALPQQAGEPTTVVFEELARCVEELGFVGVLVNPDPGEGDGQTPTMDSEYWYPLYEKLVEYDVPALLHCAGCYGRESFSEHFISEESLAILAILRGTVFEDFPTLKLIVPHGGGSVPYQLGRWAAHMGKHRGWGGVEDSLNEMKKLLRHFYYDTCLYTPEALSLLIDVVGADRVLFGTERPGSGFAFEDLKPVIEKLPNLDDGGQRLIFEDNARRLYPRAF
ncbi:amidohydrolase [Aeromicrobium sp. YIM 150415]|uniref:amidohydrolase family protein n=1 Tax=Aeromicrobium sp. YIM 150415 TaxID=2803912 RepID=UPI001962CB93|nr:amidohydrolase family protein [Aeromicrobium sp. YIM 150415]MBM9463584.1 amidohydrolase [Aeromicrobium sp. YIM 150415]